jgi:hypothetical protein
MKNHFLLDAGDIQRQALAVSDDLEGREVRQALSGFKAGKLDPFESERHEIEVGKCHDEQCEDTPPYVTPKADLERVRGLLEIIRTADSEARFPGGINPSWMILP